ncbi:hypothetical protein BJ170DRAFT_722939 [Xylariales sp. AK1849]|nr:hypothetical protein BJ170DRAFT_722939 [Xylariales sp. AK1849]
MSQTTSEAMPIGTSKKVLDEFSYFQKLPTELRFEIWRRYREAQPPLRHYLRYPHVDACIYAAVDPQTGKNVQTLAEAEDPITDARLGPSITNRKVSLPGLIFHDSSAKNCLAVGKAKPSRQPSPTFAYMDVELDIFIFRGGSRRLPGILPDMWRPDTVKEGTLFLENQCPRDVQKLGISGPFIRWCSGALDAGNNAFLEKRQCLQVVYLIIQPDCSCPYRRGECMSKFNADRNGFISWQQYTKEHMSTPLLMTRSRSNPRREIICTCFWDIATRHTLHLEVKLRRFFNSRGQSVRVKTVIEGWAK